MITPRIIRAKHAPEYLGMNRNYFNRQVKPYLVVIPRGSRGRAYDRLDLDRWAELDKARNGYAPEKLEEKLLWEDNGSPVSLNGENFGTLTNRSEGSDGFAKALAAASSTRQKST